MKAGFPHGYAKAERERRKAPQREAEAQRYAERYRGGAAFSPRSCA